MIETRGVESAAENVISHLKRIVIGIESRDADGFRKIYRVLKLAGIRNVCRGCLVGGDARQVNIGLGTGSLPSSKPFLNGSPGFLGRDVADHYNRGEIGTKSFGVILFHVVEGE